MYKRYSYYLLLRSHWFIFTRYRIECGQTYSMIEKGGGREGLERQTINVTGMWTGLIVESHTSVTLQGLIWEANVKQMTRKTTAANAAIHLAAGAPWSTYNEEVKQQPFVFFLLLPRGQKIKFIAETQQQHACRKAHDGMLSAGTWNPSANMLPASPSTPKVLKNQATLAYNNNHVVAAQSVTYADNSVGVRQRKAFFSFSSISKEVQRECNERKKY